MGDVCALGKIFLLPGLLVVGTVHCVSSFPRLPPQHDVETHKQRCFTREAYSGEVGSLGKRLLCLESACVHALQPGS